MKFVDSFLNYLIYIRDRLVKMIKKRKKLKEDIKILDKTSKTALIQEIANNLEVCRNRMNRTRIREFKPTATSLIEDPTCKVCKATFDNDEIECDIKNRISFLRKLLREI